MAIDQQLRNDLRAHLDEVLDGVQEKAMFGGAGFMWRGNLLCGVMGGELLVRLGKEDAEADSGVDGAHPMVMGARTARGWFLVPMPLDQRRRLMGDWLERAIAFGETLPAK